MTKEQEIQEHLDRLISKVKELPPQTLILSMWKGVDDIYDNVSGVSISDEKGRFISQVILVQLDCHNPYIELAKAIGEKAEAVFQDLNFKVITKSTI